MAENIRWLIDEEGKDAKVVLWAHNGHVARRVAGGVEWMGSHLGNPCATSLAGVAFRG
jgi:erythromycin esterase